MSTFRDKTYESGFPRRGMLFAGVIGLGAIALVVVIVVVIIMTKKSTATSTTSSGTVVSLGNYLPVSGQYYLVRFEGGGDHAVSAETGGLALSPKEITDPFQRWKFTKVADVSEGIATYRIQNDVRAAFTLSFDVAAGSLLATPSATSANQIWTVKVLPTSSDETPSAKLVTFSNGTKSIEYHPPTGSPSKELDLGNNTEGEIQWFYLTKL